MLYYIIKVLFVVTSKYLSWFFRSKYHITGQKMLGKKAKSVDKHLLKLLWNLRNSLEIPDKKLLEKNINSPYTSRLPQTFTNKWSYADEKGSLWDDKEKIDSELLLFFDIDQSDNEVNIPTLQDAIDKLTKDYEDIQSE